MKNNQLEEIREACIKANPELARCDCPVTEENPEGVCKNMRSGEPCQPITLADVLLAMDRRYVVSTDGGFKKVIYENGWQVEEYKEGWNLRKTLEEQSEETIQFIHSRISK